MEASKKVRAADPAVDDFRSIYEREFGFVWTCLRRFGIPPRNLPDVTHDVFLATLRSLPSFDTSRPLRPWLTGVAFRVASDYNRLAQNKRELLDAYPEVLPDARILPDQHAEEAERWGHIDRALQTLEMRFRGVIVMHDFMGYSGSEIAKTLGIPIKTVFSRLRTARARFIMSARANLGSPHLLEPLPVPLPASLPVLEPRRRKGS
jgi:RNA polymerase sigma-70 factor, ECF subfamily